MHSIAELLALAAILSAESWPITRFHGHDRFGGAPWAARRGRKRWKHLRRNR